MQKLKVGIIGAGNIFPMHAESIRQVAKDIAELVAVCDIKEDRAKKAANKYKCKYYTDYKEMIEKESLDVVHICTPHHLHKEMAVYAADKNLHIYLEKPMAINIKEAEEVYKKIKGKKVKLAISFQNRYNPSSTLAKEIIKNGELGKIFSAKLILTWHKPDEYYLKSDWKGTWEKEGGGVVIDQAIHSFDILQWIFPSEVLYVEANIFNRMHTFVKVEDEAVGIIKFKDDSYINFYTISHYSYDDDVLMEIHGEKGRIKIIKDSAEAYFFETEKLIKVSPNPDDYIDYGDGVKDYWGVCHSIEIRKFYEAIVKNEKVDINEDEGLKTQYLIHAIYESARKNEKVYIEELKEINVK